MVNYINKISSGFDKIYSLYNKGIKKDNLQVISGKINHFYDNILRDLDKAKIRAEPTKENDVRETRGFLYGREVPIALIKEAKVYVTFLFRKFGLTEEDTKTNLRLLNSFEIFGDNIGEKAVVVKYINDSIKGELDFERHLKLMDNLNLNIKDAPFIVFSWRPLDESKTFSEEDFFAISFNLVDEKIFEKLSLEAQHYARKGEFPPSWIKAKSFLGQDHKYTKKVFNGISKALKFWKDISSITP